MLYYIIMKLRSYLDMLPFEQSLIAALFSQEQAVAALHPSQEAEVDQLHL